MVSLRGISGGPLYPCGPHGEMAASSKVEILVETDVNIVSGVLA